MRGRLGTLVAALTMVLTLAQPAGARAAAPADAVGEGTDTSEFIGAPALYQGRIIDLGRGWQGAQVCAVFSRDTVECYATKREAAPATADFSTQALGDCPSGWFCLWDYTNYGGRRLQFQDAGYCQSLVPYAFTDQAQSWYNRRSGHTYTYDYDNCTVQLFLAGPGDRSSAVQPRIAAVKLSNL